MVGGCAAVGGIDMVDEVSPLAFYRASVLYFYTKKVS